MRHGRVGRRGVLVLLLVPAVLGSCESSAPQGRKTVVVLIDRSQSTARPETRETYCANVRDVVKTVSPGDALVAGWITEASELQTDLLVSTSFSAFEPGTDNPLIVGKRRAEADSLLADSLARVADTVCGELQRGSSATSQTDVLGAIGLAARVFEVEGRERNVLVLMSDMIEDSDHYHFQQMSLDEATIDRIVADEREAGRIPDLRGAEVYVAGAGGASREHFHSLRRFWIAYFQAAGAALAEENYGAALIGFGG